MNVLLQEFDTPPFSKIKIEDYKPAIQEAIEIAKQEINAITSNPEEPTFKNTIDVLDNVGDKLDRITSVFFNLNSANTNSEIQKIAQEVSPLVTAYKNDMMLNQELFERVKQVYNRKDELGLNVEEAKLLDTMFKSFARNGSNLSDDEKVILRKIDAELAKLSLQFGENVLADTNAYEMHITNEEDMAGLPVNIKNAAAETAKQRGKEGWVFTLQYPSYIPVLTYAGNREFRKKMAIAFGKRGFQQNNNNNELIIIKIINLRHQRAKLLGYKTHAHFILEDRMAKSSEKVMRFLNDLLIKAKPAAEKEFKELEEFAKELDGTEDLQKWDIAYYAEKLKQKKFAVYQEILRPYLKLENVINGVFRVANKLYDLKFEEVFDIDKYHEDVKTYKVTDEQGNFVAYLYADFHPREGKRGGAWMTSFKSQRIKDGKNERPQVSIVCNFTKPIEKRPSLLTFNEVKTLFHEFGHALHGMLANTTYKSLSGTSVPWDFVELPSQILENWCYEHETFRLFANHFQTGVVMPKDLIDNIKASSNFHEGIQTLRQLSFSLLDMNFHAGETPEKITSVKELEAKVFAKTALYPDIAENCMSTAFSHIFQGGYSAGYYSYKWAEVLDADAFEYFKQEGIFNKEVATKFKNNILSKGGTEDPMELYKKFRGREPKPEALLKRVGLLA